MATRAAGEGARPPKSAEHRRNLAGRAARALVDLTPPEPDRAPIFSDRGVEIALEVVVAGARSDVEQSVEFDEQSPLVVLDVAVATMAKKR